MPFVDIPPELIYHILEQAYYARVDSVDRKTVHNCCYVSRAWVRPAQQLLSIPLASPAFARPSFKRAAIHRHLLSGHAASGVSMRLGAYVRNLDFMLDVNSTQMAGPYMHVWRPSTLVALLYQFPRLYRLSLFVMEKGSISTKYIQQLQALVATPGRQPLRALSLEGQSDAPAVPRAPAPSGVAPVKLYELSLRYLPALEALRWLLSSSRATLQILDLHVPVLNDDYLALFIEYAPRLSSLRLHIGRPEMDALVKACVALEELVLYQSLNWPSELPASLEHLCIDELADTTLTSLDTLPELRTLTCTAAHVSHHHDFHHLVRKCDRRRIELCFGKFDVSAHAASRVLTPAGISAT
ncbi:uncharacterized protein B0H18DRAFT_1113761 [Fomitopsis serialis]|uniref:uncharacterized protein n=1 Tax=Fomitopsis serialis TaxID=139415 RepID=UPI0020078D72|nr:uncharacterized protein B0H18DRAFT_1113761 [Neoantrodia serialis]KAH9936358.1 hypothetical protein B0H18DRAFT_1113761 [Neoantrodia serialis]